VSLLMIRSIAYSRYFSTATPMQTGSSAKPRGVMTPLDAWSKAVELSGVATARTTKATSMTAPLYSHLSCCRRSPAE